MKRKHKAALVSILIYSVLIFLIYRLNLVSVHAYTNKTDGITPAFLFMSVFIGVVMYGFYKIIKNE